MTPYRARAILIVPDGAIALIKRTKPQETYYVCPGGHIEPGENPDQTVVREIAEELGIVASIKKGPISIEADNGEIELFYVCESKERPVAFMETHSAERGKYELYFVREHNDPALELLRPQSARALIDEVL